MTFSHQVQEDVAEAQNERCRVRNCAEKIHSIHHRLHNEKPNRKLYPKFIHSVFNAVGLCFKHHSGPEKEVFNITNKEATLYETELNKLHSG